MQSPADLEVKIEQRLRTMRILWLALLMSIGMYFVFTRFLERPAELELNSTLSLGLIAVALFAIPISFVVRKKFLTQSVEQQNVDVVQQGYIFASAINEASALLGFLDLFVTANPYYFAPMLVGAFGILLHFPQRQHVVDASFKRSAEI